MPAPTPKARFSDANRVAPSPHQSRNLRKDAERAKRQKSRRESEPHLTKVANQPVDALDTLRTFITQDMAAGPGHLTKVLQTQARIPVPTQVSA